METAYLSIKEASEKFGKAEITIRRLVRTIANDASSPDRSLLSPSPTDVKKLKAKRRPFSYSVSTQLLEKHFSPSARAPRAIKGNQHGGDYVRLLEQTSTELREQVRVKDDQIRSLQHAIDGLGERQREMNILMKGLQQQLLLAAPEKKRWWNAWKKK